MEIENPYSAPLPLVNLDYALSSRGTAFLSGKADVQGTVPATLGYAPPGYPAYPASLCTSLNDVVCHGIPTEKKQLKSGDVVNLDITVYLEGMHGDTNATFASESLRM